VEIRETREHIEIQCGARDVVRHDRFVESIGKRITKSEHRPPRGQSMRRPDPRPEEKMLQKIVPEISGYVTLLKKHTRKTLALALRQLLRMARDYPKEAFLPAVTEAAHYGLYDLDRLERMILRRIASDYFQLNKS